MFQQALVQRVLDQCPVLDPVLDPDEECGTCGICTKRFTRGDGYGCRACMSDSD
jgi:hypothetical protein